MDCPLDEPVPPELAPLDEPDESLDELELAPEVETWIGSRAGTRTTRLYTLSGSCDAASLIEEAEVSAFSPALPGMAPGSLSATEIFTACGSPLLAVESHDVSHWVPSKY